MPQKQLTLFGTISVLLWLNTGSFVTSNICQPNLLQQSLTIAKDNYSFCCCRNVLAEIVNQTTNYTDYYLMTRSSPTVTLFRLITGSPTLYNSSIHQCFLSYTPVKPTQSIVEECHCTDDYTALAGHRSGAYTCPKPKVPIGAFLDLHSRSGLQMQKAAEMALQEINADDNYFPEYELVLDTAGNSTNKVRSFRFSFPS